MSRRTCALLLAFTLVFLGLGFLTSCGSDDANSTTPASIAVQGGSGQSVQVGLTFAAFTVKVTNRAGHGVSGVTVTFAVPLSAMTPTSGASCAFPTGATDTEVTNSSGVATSAVCTANTIPGSYTVTGSVSGMSTSAIFQLTNTTGAATTITATAGDSQSATIGTAFSTALVATVTDGVGNGVSGVSVTFTAPSSGVSGTFANGLVTDIETTDANGVATATTFTANSTAGGPYTVAATATSVEGEADFNLTNSSSGQSSIIYTFYVSGLSTSDAPYYALAGAFTIDSNGNFIGEEDYNDGLYITSSAHITSGTSAMGNSYNQGTLTLVTDDPNLGVSGTETFALQFVSPYHALITQFDGTNTSSGAMDFQTTSAAPTGSFAFTLSGVDNAGDEIGAGGVFAVNAGNIANALVDINDYGTITTGNHFTGTVSNPDSFGRGTITTSIAGTSFATTISYYMVNSEAMRLVDMDPADTAGGSAFSQGSATFDNTSLGNSVFAIQANPWGTVLDTAVGMFSTDGNGAFNGVGDCDEDGSVVTASPFGGSYSISNGPLTNGPAPSNPNGYGFLLFDTSLQDVSTWGIYLTDPTLNLNDPNNSTGGGGALVLDLDDVLAGTVGVIVPQTDTATTSFAGPYAFGGREFNAYVGTSWEFDFVGEGVIDPGLNLSGYGLLNDTFEFFGEQPNLYTNVTYSGTATPDNTIQGRFTMPLTITTPDSSLTDASVVIYQASGSQLFWMEEDTDSWFLGPIEVQEYYGKKSLSMLARPKAQLKK